MDITQLLMATSTGSNEQQTQIEMGESARESSPIIEEPPNVQQQSGWAFSKPTSSPWFTFDAAPPDQWREKINEFRARIDLEMSKPGAELQAVLREFSSRFTGTLRDWFQSLRG